MAFADSDHQRLEKLVEEASKEKSQKAYDRAADLYSQATELQAELYGELRPGNAQILHEYGSTLFQIAVQKSEILGDRSLDDNPQGQVATKSRIPTYHDHDSEEAAQSLKANGLFKFSEIDDGLIKEQPEDVTHESGNDTDCSEGAVADLQAPDNEGGGDDFQAAFEILDLARVLYGRQLQQAEANISTEQGVTSKSSGSRHETLRHDIKTSLSEIYDIEAEIALECENFEAAANDFRTALALKKEVYPSESNKIAEGSFKLALALEFLFRSHRASEAATDGPEPSTACAQFLDEAIHALEESLSSCTARLQAKKAQSLTTSSEKERNVEMHNVESIVADMKEKRAELHALRLSKSGPTDQGDDGSDQTTRLMKRKLLEITEGNEIQDITRLVKKKISDPHSNERPKAAPIFGFSHD